MPSAARLGDLCTGHECFPPRIADTGSDNVFIDGLPAHRVGDHWIDHTCDDDTHDGVLIVGSPTVFVNGSPLGRVGDKISCGSSVLTGSPTTFIG